MIKVNLMSAKSRAAGPSPAVTLGDDPKVSKDLQKKGAIKLLILMSVPIGLYFYEFHSIPTLLAERAELQKKIDETKAFNSKTAVAVKEINKFKEEEASIQKRIGALELLSKSRDIEVRMLKLIADVMPEKAWVTKIGLTKKNAVLTGLATASPEVTNLAERLKSNILVEDLIFGGTKEESFDGISVTRFDLTCVLRGGKIE